MGTIMFKNYLMGVVLKTVHSPSQTEHKAFQVPSAFSFILSKQQKQSNYSEKEDKCSWF